MIRDPGLEGSRTEFGHGPFAAARPGSAERGASLVDHQQNGPRPMIDCRNVFRNVQSASARDTHRVPPGPPGHGAAT
jgi:hypothetical protein